MNMESYCSNCKRSLNVPDFLENQPGTCPFCQSKFIIDRVLPTNAKKPKKVDNAQAIGDDDDCDFLIPLE
ncbi:MAG: hypothetical protein JEZ07_02755 [Phycisphaerae bacterium]|nr:hypothetical protein [Phycisphaerae bacterium]